MTKQTLPSIRVEEKTLNNMNYAIVKYNKKSLVALSLQEFRRLSYELLAQLILQDKPLPVAVR